MPRSRSRLLRCPDHGPVAYAEVCGPLCFAYDTTIYARQHARLFAPVCRARCGGCALSVRSSGTVRVGHV